MFRPRSRLATLVAAATLTAVAGCGGSSGGSSDDTPKGELMSGISALGDADVLTTTLQLETTADDLQRLAAADNDSLSPKAAEAIASARLIFETTKDKTISVRAVDGGKTLLEIRGVDDVVYLQGDLAGVLDLVGKPEALDQIKAQVAQMPTFVRAFVDGEWISLNAKALSGLAGSVGVAPSPSASSSAGPKLLADLRDAVDRDITVKRLGEDETGDHLQLTGNVRTLAVDLQQAIKSSVPGGGAISDRLDAQSAPSRVITVDAWVADGALAKLALDIAQFDDDNKLPAGTSLPIVLTFEQSGDDISAPSGATPVDLTQLGPLLGALSGGGA